MPLVQLCVERRTVAHTMRVDSMAHRRHVGIIVSLVVYPDNKITHHALTPHHSRLYSSPEVE